ncbi:tyrosine-type recombinase/integrase [Pseudorhodobacter aquimaris]|uniref:tyrosine-type recombinase/integrase n=1 Tax=Pseudorhodobacter aquimaris TaxID=687412 RepID=UPI00067B6DF8|nr:site-specific integrase [Pseudorhodobacter aquimaris]
MAETGIRTPKKALTAAFVRTTTEAGKHFDGNGLFLKVKTNGAKQWVQRITIRGKRTEMGLGSADLVSLGEAREAALQNLKLARSGGDPLKAKRENQAVLTFEEAARKVHELQKPSWSNPKHAAQFISTLETYAFPALGKYKIGEITTADVLAVLTPIWLTKQETARRVRQRIGTVMKWGIAQGWRQDNPAQNIGQALPKQTQAVKHRKALSYRDVATCIEVAKASGAGRTTKLALEFLILTAARSGEVREAVWTEITFDDSPPANSANPANQAEWVIPAQRMKMKREHRVPLCARAVDILREAKDLSDGGDLVFAGTKQGKPLSDMTLSKLVKELGFDVDIHGFRTSFRTWVQEKTNVSREVAEAALAHSIKDASEAAYARSDLFEKRRTLMDDWGSYLVATKL